MWRSWRLQSLTGSAQPLFGDKLTAAFTPPVNTGVDPTMQVADTTLYQQGDRITIEPGTANADTVLVVNIKDSTHMQVSSQGATLRSHANNSVICLANCVSEIQVQANPGATNPIYLGTDSTITNAGGGSVIAAVTASFPPWRASGSAHFNNIRTDENWMAGNAADKVIVAAEVN